MDCILCPKCGSPKRCPCGAPLLRYCHGRLSFRQRRPPNVKCVCGHAWRASGEDLKQVLTALDKCREIIVGMPEKLAKAQEALDDSLETLDGQLERW